MRKVRIQLQETPKINAEDPDPAPGNQIIAEDPDPKHWFMHTLFRYHLVEKEHESVEGSHV
jgi:hypothetical protein